MSAPVFIRVGGVLYRARESQPKATPAQVRYQGKLYKLAAEPQVQSSAGNAISTMQRILHDTDMGEGAIKQLAALREALIAKKYSIAAPMWAAIQPGILHLMDKLEGPIKSQFGRAALDLDDSLVNLEKTVRRGSKEQLPPYVTVGGHLYRLRK